MESKKKGRNLINSNATAMGVSNKKVTRKNGSMGR